MKCTLYFMLLISSNIISVNGDENYSYPDVNSILNVVNAACPNNDIDVFWIEDIAEEDFEHMNNLLSILNQNLRVCKIVDHGEYLRIGNIKSECSIAFLADLEELEGLETYLNYHGDLLILILLRIPNTTLLKSKLEAIFNDFGLQLFTLFVNYQTKLQICYVNAQSISSCLHYSATNNYIININDFNVTNFEVVPDPYKINSFYSSVNDAQLIHLMLQLLNLKISNESNTNKTIFIRGFLYRDIFNFHFITFDWIIYKWWVPKAKPLPQWIGLTIVFALPTWLMIMCALTLSTIIWVTLNITHQEDNAERDLILSIINIWSIFLGVSVNRHPRTMFLRLFFMLVVIYSLHITTAYFANWINILTTPGFEKPISTLEELLDSKLNSYICPWVFYIKPYQYSSNYVEQQINWRSSRYPNLDNVTHSTLLRRVKYLETIYSIDRVAILESVEDIKFSKLTDIFHPISTPVITMPILIASNNRIIGIKMQKQILRLFANGIIEKLRRPNESILRNGFSNEPDNTPIRLTLNHFQAAFYLLVCGLFISLIVFFFEQILSKTTQEYSLEDNQLEEL